MKRTWTVLRSDGDKVRVTADSVFIAQQSGTLLFLNEVIPPAPPVEAVPEVPAEAPAPKKPGKPKKVWKPRPVTVTIRAFPHGQWVDMWLEDMNAGV